MIACFFVPVVFRYFQACLVGLVFRSALEVLFDVIDGALEDSNELIDTYDLDWTMPELDKVNYILFLIMPVLPLRERINGDFRHASLLDCSV